MKPSPLSSLTSFGNFGNETLLGTTASLTGVKESSDSTEWARTQFVSEGGACVVGLRSAHACGARSAPCEARCRRNSIPTVTLIRRATVCLLSCTSFQVQRVFDLIGVLWAQPITSQSIEVLRHPPHTSSTTVSMLTCGSSLEDPADLPPRVGQTGRHPNLGSTELSVTMLDSVSCHRSLFDVIPLALLLFFVVSVHCAT